MASDMRIYIKTTNREQRIAICDRLGERNCGNLGEKFDDGSFDFYPHENSDCDAACEILDDMGFEYELL